MHAAEPLPAGAAPAAPTAAEIAAARSALAGRILRTPVLRLSPDRFGGLLPDGAEIWMKLELFQETGSFKARGALLSMDALPPAARAAGVVTASAGNHARAVAWAARREGVSAKIVMPEGVDPARIAACTALGAEVVLEPSLLTVFDRMQRIAAAEGRAVLHPFEGPLLTLGTATCGAELAEDVPGLDLAVIPVGGGGLLSGMAPAIRMAAPGARVWGVEPEGADAMARSFAAGRTVRLDRVETIADSLGAPMTLPHSFAVARAHAAGIVRVSDDALRAGMRLLHEALRITAEPACAAGLAALLGPLRAEAEGRRVGLVACGSNISVARFAALAGLAG